MKRLIIGAAAAALVLGGCAAYVDHRADRAEARWEDRWPPQGAFITVDGTRVHYLQRGTGPDVVLIHGAWGNLRDFSFSLMDRLADRGFRVTAFDRPGMGYTGRVAATGAADQPGPQAKPETAPSNGPLSGGAESPAQQAALLAGAAERLGIARPVVVGHSFGGSVAMAWALDHDAAAVVSLAGAIMPWPGGLDTTYRVLGTGLGGAAVAPLVTAFITQNQVTAGVANSFAPQSMPDGYAEHFGPGLALRRESLRANARQVKVLKPHLREMAPRYGALDIPVEILHGTADDTVGLSVHSEAARDRLPQGALTVLDGVGHMPHHAREGAAVEAILRAAERAGLR